MVNETLERAIYMAINNTPAGSAFAERLTVGDLVSVAALDECAENIASTRNEEDAAAFLCDLALDENIRKSALERVMEVLEDFASPEEGSGGVSGGEMSERMAGYQALK